MNKNLINRRDAESQRKKEKIFSHRLTQTIKCFIVFLLFALGGQASYAADSQPKITVTPKQINLGVIKKDEVKLYKIIIGNKGKGDLYITNIPAPNEKTGISLGKNAIKPGKKIELTFFYRGIDKGKIKDNISIESNDPKNPSVKIILKGEVR